MLARTLSFLFLVSLSAATAILIYDGTLQPFAGSSDDKNNPWLIGLEWRSILLGGAIGVIIGQVLSVPWSQIPARVMAWFSHHQTTFVRLIMAAVCIAILIYY